jgi:L-alanine-DL-glutamate epimerase-like enolase superfamily enzyme
VAVNGLIGALAPEAAAAEARRLAATGHRCLKVKGGEEPIGAILDRLMAVRDAIGPDVALRLDLNGSLDEASAADLLRRVRPLELEYVEQPIPPEAGPRALARLRGRGDVPIAADEAVRDVASAEALMAAEAVDVLVVKPARAGGLPEARRIVELAAATGVAVTVSTLFETGVGIAAALHVAATVPGDGAHGLATAALLESDLLAEPLTIAGGRMTLPTGPGLGVRIDSAAVARYRSREP